MISPKVAANAAKYSGVSIQEPGVDSSRFEGRMTALHPAKRDQPSADPIHNGADA